MATVSRTTTKLLPEVFQTERNKKFINATLDQFTQKGELEKISGFVGSTKGPSFKTTDTYFTELNNDRQNYQLEPTVNYKKEDGAYAYHSSYIDLVNQIDFLGGNKNNHHRLFEQQSHSWAPPIDIDLLVNYRNYYWIPEGPSPVQVDITTPGSVSTIKVTNNAAGAYNFSGYTGDNPTLTLYRGNTYKFEVDAKGHPFYIKTTKTDGSTSQYESDSSGYVSDNGADNGTVTFTVPATDASSALPDILFYACANHTSMQGSIIIEDLDDGFTTVDITTEILGKKTYTTPAGVIFENGLKVKFAGTIPAAYKNKEYYVEGVGNEIVLLSTDRMIVPEGFSSATQTVVWDADGTQNFDDQAWDAGFDVPTNKDYFTINRNSKDFNAWSRSNRWVHESVLTNTATYNGHTVSLDQTKRAKRPIIQFEGNIQLYNYGNVGLEPITALETDSTDALSNINGKGGQFVDGVNLKQGDRVIFKNDTDTTVANNIYTVDFVSIDSSSNLYINLELAEQPVEGNTVVIKAGTDNKGKQYRFNGTGWQECQQKTKVQQQPLFALYNSSKVSLDDTTTYPASSFMGSTIFEVEQSSTGTKDTEYGIQIKYENFGTVADIVFKNTLADTNVLYLDESNGQKVKVNTASAYYLKNLIDVEVGVDSTVNNTVTTELGNLWSKQINLTKQRIIDVVIVKDELKIFKLKNFNKASAVINLELNVFVNNKKKTLTTDYTLVTQGNDIFVKFVNSRTVGDKIVFESYAPFASKNTNGRYEIPDNLERNGLNQSIVSLTLGEINNHVASIAEEVPDFTGTQPGSNNFKDLPNTKKYGRRILQHAGSIPLATYCLTNNNSNYIASVKYVAQEYQNFKNSFVKAIDNVKDGTIRDQVDDIIRTVSLNKSEEFAFFYSDMIGYSENFTKISYTVTDNNNKTYGLSAVFDKGKLSQKAVYVWVNDVQAVHGTDYTFDSTSATLTFTTAYTFAIGDKIEIREYSNTNGSHVPPTPTALGLYPAYEPKKYVDNTYRSQLNDSTTTTVLQGHDGSLIKAYGDIRDDLILELEKRIYNNIKVTYDEKNLHDLNQRPGKFRNSAWTESEWDEIEKRQFMEWAGLNQIDYTTHAYFDAQDPFTWNYSQVGSRVDGNKLKGYWRGIYKDMYDTDRPHTHPWEMLGFAEKPSYWESRYGASPYTSGNEILWNDLENGFIASGDRKGNYDRYARPGLNAFIPVDDAGNLKAPNDFLVDRIIANQSEMKAQFKEGDHAPAETAWRRSSDYPFATQIINALTSPAKYFGVLWDTARIFQNPAGQYVYSTTGTAVQPKDFVFYAQNYTDADDESQDYKGAGYHVFIIEYLKGKNLDQNTNFITPIKNLRLNLAYKLGGFTDKTNLKVIADSVSPGSTSSSVFIPPEDYTLYLHKSTPVVTAKYSGVIIQKTDTGFKVIGYDPYNRAFKIFKPRQTQVSGNLSVGQTTESFFNWQQDGFYVAGSLLRNDDVFYRVNTTFTAGTSFDETNLTQLGSALPLQGGVSVPKYNSFDTVATTVPYGTEYRTKTEVSNFIQGYEQYLKSVGFSFDGFSSDLTTNTDWSLSIKEFLFWSTQNWASGTVIALSPASESLKLNNTSGVVDTLLDPIEGYQVLQQEDLGIPLNDLNVIRDGNETVITTRQESDGIYYAKFNVVQKEHVLILENSTVFSDVMYDPSLGFRQERIKLTGFKTADWNGDLYAPGFMYDAADIEDWVSDKDYNLGDVVIYQTKYYIANKRHTGTEKFENTNWTLRSEKPVSSLIPNLDYRTAQFEDFYNLDTDNFDEGQQTLARHLIGYQPRQYLDNLGIDESSQYKFYQGFIKEKGTINSITKMLNAQFRAGETNKYNVFEEWAFRVGGYGGTRTQQDIEFALDSKSFGANPQLTKLLSGSSINSQDPAYQILKKNLRIVPEDYDSKPFVEYDGTKHNGRHSAMSVFKFKNAGPVNLDYVNGAFLTIDQIKDTKAGDTLEVGDYVAVAKNYQNTWDLLRVTESGLRIDRYDKFEGDGSTQLGTNQVKITTNKPHGLAKDELIIIQDVDFRVDGLHKIPARENMDSTVSNPNEFSIVLDQLPVDDGSSMVRDGILLKLVSVKLSSTEKINDSAPPRGWRKNDIVCVTNNYETNTSGKWVNYQNTYPYLENTSLFDFNVSAHSEYGHAIATTKDGASVFVSAPGDQGGKLYLNSRNQYNDFPDIFGIFPSHTSTGATLSGTVTVTSGSTSVTGNNTLFLTELAPGDRIKSPLDNYYTVISIESDIAMTVEEEGLATESSGSFKLAQFDRYGSELALSCDAEDTLLVSAPFASGFVKVVTLDGGDFSTAPSFVIGNAVDIYSTDESTKLGDGTIKSWNSDTYVMGINTTVQLNANYKIASTSSDGSTTVIAFVQGAESTLTGEGYAEILTKDTGGLWGFKQSVTGRTPASNDNFGSALAISGDSNYAFFGVPGINEVEVYKKNTGGSYDYLTTISAPDILTGEKFGSSIATDKTGSIVAIGAPLHGIVGADSTSGNGAVFVYANNDDQFLRISKLVSDTKQIAMEFGHSITMNEAGTKIVVGAPKYNQGTSDSTLTSIPDQGKVFVYASANENVMADGSTTAFTLSFAPTNENDIGIFQTLPDSTTSWLIPSTVFADTTTATADDTEFTADTVNSGTPWYVDGSTTTLNFTTAPAKNSVLTIYRWQEQQGIVSNAVGEYNRFGEKVVLHPTKDTLAVSSKNATFNKTITFDKFADDGSTLTGETTFDYDTTRFVDAESEAGNVRVYGLYGDYYVLDQQMNSSKIDSGDKFGQGLAVSDRSVFVGAPKDDTKGTDSGLFIDFAKKKDTTVGWETISEQGELIDPYSIKQNYLFDTVNNQTIGFIDWIDPIKGKLPGPAEAELDLIMDVDPAFYTDVLLDDAEDLDLVSINKAKAWKQKWVGKLWLDTSNMYYLWYEQGTAEYRNANWGRLFPGSEVVVYEWVESDLRPEQWAELVGTRQGQSEGISGVPKSTKYYVKDLLWDVETQTFKPKYYYWVSGKQSIPEIPTRSISAANVANLIADPRGQGYSYTAFIKNDAISYANIGTALSRDNIVHHVEWSTTENPLPKHDEWLLIKEGDEKSKPNTLLKRKLIDSLVGTRNTGAGVPDITLPQTQRYGIEDGQSLIKNRVTVLTAVLQNINAVLKQHKIVSSKKLGKFDLEEEQPTSASGEYDFKVASYTELNFLDTINTPTLTTGSVALVESDSESNGYWALYQYQSDKTWYRTKVQSYDTKQYWQYKDWYASGYSKDTIINHNVATEDLLLPHDSDVEIGETVKITTSFDGNFRLVIKTKTATFEEIGLGNATIEIKSLAYAYEDNALGYGSDTYDQNNYDQQPTTELRNILEGVIDDIYIDDLELEYNNLWFFAVQQILSEQLYVDWAIKTSFLTVENDLKTLSTEPTYKPDQQEALLDYIDEVKPFHTKVRQYRVNYAKTDTFGSDMTDFDNAAYWDTSTESYKAPDVDESAFDVRYQSAPSKIYKDNYKLSVLKVIVADGGSGYTEAPVVTISGGGGTGAKATAFVSNGSVSKVTVTNGGSGYVTTPTITITGGGRADSTGNQAKVYAVIDNDKIRQINTTLQFNRTTGSNIITNDTVTEWSANTKFTANSNIRFEDQIYKVLVEFTSGDVFTDAVTLADSTTTSDITVYLDEWTAVDYIKAYYTTGAGMPGVQDSSTVVYGQLMTGLEYPGTQVVGPTFDKEATYDAANYDMVPYDGQIIDEQGVPTPSYELGLDKYVDGVGFTNSLAGTRPSDVITEGNQFIDEYSSYAPEEVVPGSTFDTLDMQVYTNPAAGSPIMRTNSHIADGSTVSFAIGQTPAEEDGVFVYVDGNLRKRYGDPLGDYTIGSNNTVVFRSAPAADRLITIQSFSISGSRISIKRTFTGDGTTTAFNLPVPFTLTDSTVNLTKTAFVTVNGAVQSATLSEGSDSASTDVTLSSAPTSGTTVQITLFDADPGDTPYSQVSTQAITDDGSSTTYALTQTPADYGPLHNTVVVERNGIRLTPPDTAYYSGDGTTYAFKVPTNVNALSKPSSADIEVYLNGTKQIYGTDWFFESLGITTDQDDETSDTTATTTDAASVSGTGVVYFNTRPNDGDGVAIVVKIGHDYIIEGSNLILTSSSGGTAITVTAKTTYDVSGQENNPRGITFNVDGTKMFIVGTTGDDVNEYTLSRGFDLTSTVTFVDSFAVTQCPNPTAVKFNTDGTKMFVTGVGNSNVHSYTLTTGFDVSTASFNQTLVTSGTDDDNFGLDFNNDGTKMYITGNQNDSIYEYVLTTAFDISTATLSKTLSVQSQDIEPFGIEFNTDGTRLFIVGTRGNGVDEYHLSSAFDISSATHVGFVSVSSQEANPSGIAFNTTGNKMFIVGDTGEEVNEFALSVPFRLVGGSAGTDELRVTSFTNHDLLGIRTEIFEGKTGLTSDTTAHTTDETDTLADASETSTHGHYTLSRVPTNTDYLWVTFNGQRLIAGVDYEIQGTRLYIPKATYSSSDTIVITSISTTSTSEAIGYRIFKDMINRTHYKRIADANNTKLAKNLRITDDKIFVQDVSLLPTPDADNNIPGVVFINKERITYFRVSLVDNTLEQLMRGTLGTGAVDLHATGSDVIDAGATQTIPGYSDTTTTCTHKADGSTTVFALFNADSTAFVPRLDGSDVTVFVGGTKQTSGFTFDGSSATITFATAPISGRRIEIVRKTGNVWVDQGTSTAGNGLGLQGATGVEATFLLNSPTKLP